MKLPRDINGSDLVNVLKRLEYYPVRQTGSHIRLTSFLSGEHHITIPAHNPLKIGTLSAILTDIASHFGKTKSEIISLLFD